MDRIRDILGPTGLLAERLSGYRHRPQQQAMAEMVERLEGVREKSGTSFWRRVLGGTEAVDR